MRRANSGALLGGVAINAALDLRNQLKRWIEPFDIEDVFERAAKIDARFREPNGVDMGAQEILIAQVEARRRDFAADHTIGTFKEELVVRTARGAVGEDQRRLAAAPGSPAALSVIGRGLRDISHIDYIQFG